VSVSIYEITRQFTTFKWLCDRHLAERTKPATMADLLEGRHGWTAKKCGETDAGGCEDCAVERQNES
jgi:hypothetical protein